MKRRFEEKWAFLGWGGHMDRVGLDVTVVTWPPLD